MADNPLVPKLRLLLILVLVAALVILIRANTIPVERMVLTIDVPNTTDPAAVDNLLDLLAQKDASATFFVTGNWAFAHPETTLRIAEEGDIGCYTMTGARLALLDEERVKDEVVRCDETLENLTGRNVEGFRAPGNEISDKVYAAMDGRFLYDSSTYQRYSWFWERPPSDLIEVQTSSVLFLPLHDRLGLVTLPLGDFFFYLARKARQSTVIIRLSADLTDEYRLDVAYLIDYYREWGVPVTSIAEWMAE